MLWGIFLLYGLFRFVGLFYKMTNLVNHKGTFRVSYEFDSGNYLKFTLDNIETHQRKTTWSYIQIVQIMIKLR